MTGLVGGPLLMGGLGPGPLRALPPLNPALCVRLFKLEEITVSASATTENINNAFCIIF